MVPRSEHERQLELARQENEVAVFQAVDAVEKKAKLHLNMCGIAMAKIVVVKNAAMETPDRPVKAVWDVADKARPSAAGSNQLDELYSELEELRAGIRRLKSSETQMKERLDARSEAMKRGLVKQLHDGRAKQCEEVRAEVAKDQLDLADTPSTEQEAPADSLAPDPMDISMAAAPIDLSVPKYRQPSTDRLKARPARFGTTPISTTDMASWTLSPEQAKGLIKNNKTIIDILKANIISKVDQQTWPLKILIAQKDDEIAKLKLGNASPEARLKEEVHANLCAENTQLHVKIATLLAQLRVSGSRTAYITRSALQTPNQPVKAAWEAAVREGPTQLLHRTKPRSQIIQ